MAKKYKLHLSDVLKNLDNKNYGYYDSLTEDEKKEFNAWLVMRYASSSKSSPEHYLIYVNELVNRDFSTLRKHPKLQWMLLSMIGNGYKQKYDHSFIRTSAGNKKDKIDDMISQVYPWMNEDELALFKIKNSKDDIWHLLESNNFDEKEIKSCKFFK